MITVLDMTQIIKITHVNVEQQNVLGTLFERDLDGE